LGFILSAAASAQRPYFPVLALQLRFPKISESMGNHDSKIVDAGSVD
jgi:hypothetical protein